MIFDSHRDDADTQPRSDTDGTNQRASVAYERVRATAAVAISIIAKHGDGAKGLDLIRKHIVGLDLPPERINRLRIYAADEARPHGHGYFGDHPDDELVSKWNYKGRCTYGEWRRANRLVMRAALIVLMDVPLRSCSDFDQFAGVVRACPGALPKDMQAKALRKLQSFVTAYVTGGSVNLDPSFVYTGRKPWRGYKPNDLLALAPVKGRLTKGDYILECRSIRRLFLMRIDGVTHRHLVTQMPGFRGIDRIKRKEWIVRHRVINRFPMRQEAAAQ